MNLNGYTIKYMCRVEVANKKEVEKVLAAVKDSGALCRKGKPYGKPGNVRCVVYVESEPFGGRDYLRDFVSRVVPGSVVRKGEEMEIIKN